MIIYGSYIKKQSETSKSYYFIMKHLTKNNVTGESVDIIIGTIRSPDIIEIKSHGEKMCQINLENYIILQLDAFNKEQVIEIMNDKKEINYENLQRNLYNKWVTCFNKRYYKQLKKCNDCLYKNECKETKTVIEENKND